MSTVAAYCINLDRRRDRWAECRANYAEQGLPPDFVMRWSACEDADFGALGCARSHMAVLSHFLTQRREPYCLILEDDFDFLRSWGSFADSFNGLLQRGFDWDALLLAGTYTMAYAENPAGLAKVVESQSTSGYLLPRKYVPQVLHSFSKSVVTLELFAQQQPRVVWVSKFAIDALWKQLQYTDRWYIMTPPVGHQRPSYSDIEKRVMDYSVSGYQGTPQ